ncbi:MAG TPA: site-2 protease family protein [Anaerolineales bacterium]|nr:site-2 protease family protein [Anaerolineales bacterium]
MLFQPIPPTRYDLNFNLAGFPIRVHPLFWLIALLLGAGSGDLLQILLWVLVVFISILIHELGHALAFRFYGLSSQILLHFAGGLTIPESTRWGNRWASVALRPIQEIAISLAGPGAGFLFAALIALGVTLSGGAILTNWLFGFIPIPTVAFMPVGGRIVNLLVNMLLWVNVFWGLINLLPVYPLDGGHVARYGLLMADPVDGVRKSLWLSVIVGGLIAVAALVFLRSIYMALLFALMAFQSYQSLQGRTF